MSSLLSQQTASAVLSLLFIVVFIVELIYAGGFVPLSHNPMIGFDALTLAKLGSTYTWRLQTKWEVWRVISPVFLHSGVLHVLTIILLMEFCASVELRWGWKKLLLVFLVSGMAVCLFVQCLQPSTLRVGATGAIFGVVGAVVGELLLLWSQLNPAHRNMLIIRLGVGIFAWILLSVFAKYLDNWSLVGGLIIGFVQSFILFSPEHSYFSPVRKYGKPLGGAVYLIILVVLVGALFGGLVTGRQLFRNY